MCICRSGCVTGLKELPSVLPPRIRLSRIIVHPLTAAAAAAAAAASSAAPLAAASRRMLTVGSRRGGCSRYGGRRPRRWCRLPKDLCAGFLVPALLLLVVSALLGTYLLGSGLGLRGAVVLVVTIVEGHAGHSRRGVPLGNDGLAAEDLDLGFERGSEGDVVGGIEEVECLGRLAAEGVSRFMSYQ